MSKPAIRIRIGNVKAGRPAPDPYAPIPAPLTPPELLALDVKTFDRKQADYAPGGTSYTVACDTFENFRFSAIFSDRVCRGLAPDDPRRSIAVLLGVKISRLMTLGIGGAAANEPMDDTHGDLRVYDALLDGFSRQVR